MKLALICFSLLLATILILCEAKKKGKLRTKDSKTKQDKLKQSIDKTEKIWFEDNYFDQDEKFLLKAFEKYAVEAQGYAPNMHRGKISELYPPLMQQHPHVMLESGGAVFEWAGGIVPYYIDTKSYDTIQQTQIKSAMTVIERISCIEFKKLAQEPKETGGFTYVSFTNPKHEKECVHEVKPGKNGEAVMVLGFECMRIKHLIHSLFHVLGFPDEVTHPQRDQFIRILWSNIQPKYVPLFMIDKNHPKPLVEYDSTSVMHFHEMAYSVNGRLTILTKVPGLQIDPANVYSESDVKKLSMKYDHECRKRQVGNSIAACNNCQEPRNHVENEISKEKEIVDANTKSEEKSKKKGSSEISKEKQIVNATSEEKSKKKLSNEISKEKEVVDATSEEKSKKKLSNEISKEKEIVDATSEEKSKKKLSNDISKEKEIVDANTKSEEKSKKTTGPVGSDGKKEKLNETESNITAHDVPQKELLMFKPIGG